MLFALFKLEKGKLYLNYLTNVEFKKEYFYEEYG